MPSRVAAGLPKASGPLQCALLREGRDMSMEAQAVRKIVSDGQTSVDRAALDVALELMARWRGVSGRARRTLRGAA